MSAPLAFGPYLLDRSQARLTRDGQPLALVGRPFDLLCALAERAQRLVEKDELLDAVWGHRHVTESSLKGAVNALRLTLGDDAKAPRYIETVPRRGYRFIAALQPVADAGHAGDGAAAAVLAAPQRPGDAPAPPTGNLPREPEPLVGRERELAALDDLLRAHRLVTLTGLGGVGKTRLAIAAAGGAGKPAWLVRLDELSDPSLMLPALAGLLLHGREAADSPRALGRALVRHDCLLVLDNAEHLLEAVSDLCAALLDEAPRLRLLVTSQAPLRLRQEAVLPLEPLGLPDATTGAAPDPGSYDAARLLCARIRHHLPGWTPGPGDAAPLAALCRALDGVPLALELAAARVPLLGLAGVCSRLDQRFALLTRGHRGAAARHRTLAAALEWTFGLLSDAERDALQRLAVFPGSFSLEACEGVLGPDALDLVEELRARSLLVVLHRPLGLRLRMFESVRSLALNALAESGREPDARHRLLQWIAGRVEGVWLTDATTGQESWLPALAEDLDSVREALRYGLSPAADAPARDLALQLAADSGPLWQRAGALLEGWRWIDQAWTLAGAAAADRLDAAALDDRQLRLDLARVDFCASAMQGDAREAAARVLALLADARVQADPLLNFYARRAHFWLRVRLGFDDPREGPRQACDQLKTSCPPMWPELTQRWWLRAEANVARLAGDFEGTLHWVDRHTALCRRHGALANARALLYQPLLMLALLGRWEEARAQALEHVAELQAAGVAHAYPFNLASAAAVLLRSGPLGDNRATVLQALRVLCDAQLLWWVADALGWAAWHDGRADDAREVQRWADGLVAQRNERRGPFFGGMREALVALLPPGPPDDDGPDALRRAASTPLDRVLDLALGAGTAQAVLPAR